MKKIISMLTVSALAFGSVFADVSLEYTQKGYISTNEGGSSKYLDLNGYDEDGTGATKHTDTDIAFEVSNDVAGVHFEICPYGTDAETRTNDSTTYNYFDSYYGWVKFLGGTMELKSGLFVQRRVARMNQDAGNWNSNDYERYKPGVMGGTYAKDVTNLPTVNGTKALTSELTYTGKNLYVSGALITNTFKSGVSTNATSSTESGFGVEAGLILDENTKLQAVFKTTTEDEIALGAFFTKNGLTLKEKKLDLMTGVSFGNQSLTDDTEAAVDLRARVYLSEKLTLTTMNNVSYYNYTTTTAHNGDAATINVWDMAGIAYKLSDALKLTATAEWEYQDITDTDAGTLDLIPGVTYSFGEGADISSGIIIRTTSWPHPTSDSFSIPFILHVAL